ncbi:unnamed protein product [Caenorhabditis angaria]|uniref:Uncharacterized protein n=1 Tax=Caenorhabditis angaria TaxID=860376 RepID=A0A9P1IVD7_9PELO|nr:unnamed protein product [Caenorhabditis angaria]
MLKTHMLLLHYWNVSYFLNENREWFEYIRTYLYISTIIYIIDVFNMIFYIWMVFKAKQFHYNFNLIVGFFLTTHFIHDIAILTLRCSMIITKDFNSINPMLIKSTINVSIYSMGAALCCLPFFMLERCCATYYLSDYEVKKRHHISYIITFSQFSIGCFTCFCLQNETNTCIVVSGLVGLNGIAMIILVMLKMYNNKEYKRYHEGVSEYSLTQRYQISENIKSLSMITKMILYMGVMNSTLVIVMMLSSFHLTDEFRFISALAMDICIFIYAYSIPQIMTMCSDKWKSQLRKTLPCFNRKQAKLSPLRDTYGFKMDQDRTVEDHFESLKSSWEHDLQKKVHQTV